MVVTLVREVKHCAEIDAKKHPRTAAMVAKLQADQGKATCRRCKWIAERPDGWIQRVPEFRQFGLLRLHRVQAEFKLVCLALNLRRIGSLKAPRGPTRQRLSSQLGSWLMQRAGHIGAEELCIDEGVAHRCHHSGDGRRGRLR